MCAADFLSMRYPLGVAMFLVATIPHCIGVCKSLFCVSIDFSWVKKLVKASKQETARRRARKCYRVVDSDRDMQTMRGPLQGPKHSVMPAIPDGSIR